VSNSSVRTVVLFGIIAVILIGAAVGGVRLIKARNDSYASSQHKVAQTDTKQQPAQQPQQKKDNTSSSSSTSTSQTKTAVPPSTGTTPAPTSNSTSTPTPKTTPSVAPQQDTHLPATSGFSPSEALPTLTLMVLAGLFGSKLLRARADYRRYIGL
jgi:cytoskeletal protein RodZ